MNNETLLNLFAEIEAILNSRSLTPITYDSEAEKTLLPNNLLMVHSQPNLSPRVFTNNDNYAKKRWRQIQIHGRSILDQMVLRILTNSPSSAKVVNRKRAFESQ